ncbi:site-2 protease family protein [Bacillus sp. UNC438CL73TsuS30]|uniref:site-2 protease family protein n=1 Tax=Bacillus sp. UNC438CL73TsuS30 TaxID=1340434 RepID=UPI000551660A|nr:site-2 protease family protein [Bacillus sp. UNC438CL73TsuS30]
MKKSVKKSSWGILGTLGLLLLGKLKYLLVAFKILKLQTLISMFLTLGTYAIIFGWQFAAALVYLLFVHEMGHLYAAKKLKLSVSPAVFIPFIGAAIGLKEMPKSAKEEGYLAYMGPLFGLFSFLPAIPLYFLTHEPFWALCIILGGTINLFNLIPITPLDGGRIAAGISTKLWGLGIVLLVVFSIKLGSFIGFLIVILGSIEWYRTYKKQKSLNSSKEEVEKLGLLLYKLKQTSNHVGFIQPILKEVNWNISQPEVKKAFDTLVSEIEKMSKNFYLQQLSGVPNLSEEAQIENEQVIQQTLIQFEKVIEEYKKDVQITETYYKTDKKTKWQLFLIYLGLIVALSISYFFGNEILMNHPEIRNALNR